MAEIWLKMAVKRQLVSLLIYGTPSRNQTQTGITPLTLGLQGQSFTSTPRGTHFQEF